MSDNKKGIDRFASIIAFAISSIALAIILGLLFLVSSDIRQDEISDNSEIVMSQDSVIQVNKDSMAAFMSIIIEANHKLVDNPEQCRNLVLVEMKQPCYVEINQQEIKWSEPINKNVYIWIPTDKKTWLWCEPGQYLTDCDSLCIGDDFYTGDLQRVDMKIVRKEDRGF